MTSGAGQAARELEIPRQMADTTHALETLNEKVKELHARLGPVLRPPEVTPPKQAQPVAPPVTLCDVAHSVRAGRFGIEGVTDEIVEILSRLEI